MLAGMITCCDYPDEDFLRYGIFTNYNYSYTTNSPDGYPVLDS